MHRIALASLLSSHVLIGGALAQTWCGKHYMSTQSIVAPGGNFPLPSPSSGPLLAFQCTPFLRPYLAEDISSSDGDFIAFYIDAPVVSYEIANAAPIQLSESDLLNVTISLDGRTIANGSVPLNATAYKLSFSLEGIIPQMVAYNVSCQATYAESQTFSASTMLSVLPNPTNASVTKMDFRTGAVFAKPLSGSDDRYKPTFPFGFYTSFDYLASNLSVIDELKEQGFTIIHPIPPFDNQIALNAVLDRMQEVGLYLMYDMRYSYMNSTSLTEQVNQIKNRPNLLLWYTGDEPDGTSDPLNATTIAYDLIYSLDGYHPVSLVLNCQDYYWTEYTTGTDFVMQDVYMIGNNVTWSNEWNTSCTPDYGDCGCDNCASIPAGDIAAVPPNSSFYGTHDVPPNSGIGSYFDISDRVASFKNRLEVMGWERSKAVWTVPQGFGGSEYWLRTPTGEEWVVQSIMGINQGAMGVVSWSDPTTPDIKSAASALALSLPDITQYLFRHDRARAAYVVGGASVATWRPSASAAANEGTSANLGSDTLVLAANTNYVYEWVSWSELDLVVTGARTVFTSGIVELGLHGFELGPVSSVALVVSSQRLG